MTPAERGCIMNAVRPLTGMPATPTLARITVDANGVAVRMRLPSPAKE